jgi:hypothetical protein
MLQTSDAADCGDLADTAGIHLLSGRQRVAAASLLRRRAELPPEAQVAPDDEAYQLWYELVCSEMQRLGVIEPSHIKEFRDRAGVPSGGVDPWP